MRGKERRLEADGNFSEGKIGIKIYPYQLGDAFNGVLREAGRRERMRWLVYQGDTLGRGIWTPEEASEIAQLFRLVEGAPQILESEVSNKWCPGWEELSFNVNREVVDVLVEGRLFEARQGEGEKYRVKLPDIYLEGLDIIIAEVTEMDDGEAVNVTLSIIEPGQHLAGLKSGRLEGPVGVWTEEAEEGITVVLRTGPGERYGRVYLPLDPDKLNEVKEVAEKIYQLETLENFNRKRVPAQARSEYNRLALRLDTLTKVLPPIDFSSDSAR
jgi:hypothetical protein